MPHTSFQYIEELLEETITRKASDLHISVGHPPVLRLQRALVPMEGKKEVTPEDSEAFAFALLSESQKERFLEKKEIDFSYNFKDKARFRINIFFQRGVISIALRLIPLQIPTIEELRLPSIFHTFTSSPQGLVLVAGPSSHGKSTTLAAMLDEINKNKSVHMITIEDPIEYIFHDDKSIVDQREVYQDALSFSSALRSALRQDPDVIMVGEMRDTETIATAITAAETGHLVFATLHTNSAPQTIHRIVDAFPSQQQDQVRSQLSASLLGVISQRLIPRLEEGLVPACEVMFNTPAIGNLIRENKIHELPLVIETSSDMGMTSLNRALAYLVRTGEVSSETAVRYSHSPNELRKLIS